MIPERIWLQWDDSKNEFDCRCITWCDSPIPEADNIEYVRSPQWVSVADRLPEKIQAVIGTDGKHTYESTIYHSNGVWFWVDEPQDKVKTTTIAWQPLPAPPKA